MVPIPAPRRHWLLRLVLGIAFGAALAALLALLVVATSLALGGTLMVVIHTAFGGSAAGATALVAGGLLAVLGAAALLGTFLLRRGLPALRALGAPGMGGWVAPAAGVFLGLALGVWALPAPIANSALQFTTGLTPQQRAQSATLDAARQRLQLVQEAYPDGTEAALIAAINLTAGPVNPPGSLLTSEDVQTRVAALRGLLPTVPPGWAQVVLGTIAELQDAGGPPAQGPMDDALAEAAHAGSRAFQLLAAQRQEDIAQHLERGAAGIAADTAWQRALQGYAAAGAAFEVARLRDETLPERLRTRPVPAGIAKAIADAIAQAAALPAAPPAAQVRAELSERLWQLAQALGDDARWDVARPGERDLARVAALVALELAPDASAIARANPAQRWGTSPWAVGRWVIALRQARGDCLAALELADATRQRRRPAVVNQAPAGASELDLAWAVAWSEAGEACAQTDAERARVQAYRQGIDYLRLEPRVLEAARTGVAATRAALR